MEDKSLAAHVISTTLIVVLTVLISALVQLLSSRGMRAVQAMTHLRETRRGQLVTLLHIIRWGVHLILVASAVLMILSTLGIDITPLLASAGVAGLAVSLGAQSLIKDFIGGVLVLLENQYAVGDIIQVAGVTGEVERLSLRATYVRDLNGHLHVIANGDVRSVANQSRDWSRAMVDLGVAYEADLERALQILNESVLAFAQDPAFAPDLLEPPQILGPLTLGDSAITVRAMVKTPVGKQWGIARALRKWLLAACEREGIELPYPRQEVWVRNLGTDRTAAEKG
jgi:small conductance mechanosensitive channel